jgi:hypothetical protein
MGQLNDIYKKRYLFVNEKINYHGTIDGNYGIHLVEVQHIIEDILKKDENIKKIKYERFNDYMFIVKFKESPGLFTFKKEDFRKIGESTWDN